LFNYCELQSLEEKENIACSFLPAEQGSEENPIELNSAKWGFITSWLSEKLSDGTRGMMLD